MLKVGIVGNKSIDTYVKTIKEIPSLQLQSIFDPSFQIEHKKHSFNPSIVYSFNDLIQSCNAVIFTSENRLYYPYIEKAIKYGKAVFLKSTTNLTLDEHFKIYKLSEEAKETLQLYHPYLHYDFFKKINKNCIKPSLYKVLNSGIDISNLMQTLRFDLAAIFSIIKSPIKNISVHSSAILNAFPDTFSINLAFDNGCQAQFLADSVDVQREHNIRLYQYNKLHKIDLSNKKISPSKILFEDLKTQLTNFYYSSLCLETPIHNIEHELFTQQIIEKIKDKIKFSFNII